MNAQARFPATGMRRAGKRLSPLGDNLTREEQGKTG
jgi:hypothetical protein